MAAPARTREPATLARGADAKTQSGARTGNGGGEPTRRWQFCVTGGAGGEQTSCEEWDQGTSAKFSPTA